MDVEKMCYNAKITKDMPSNFKIFLDFKIQNEKGFDICGNSAQKRQLQILLNFIDKSYLSKAFPKISDINTSDKLQKFIKNTKGIVKNDAPDYIKKFIEYIRSVLKLERNSLVCENVKGNQISTKVTIIDQQSGQPALQDKGYKYAYPPHNMLPADLIKYGLDFGASNWNPQIKDIKQGRVGDCYLLAALLSLISKDPNSIKKCFLNRATLNIDDYVKIRFFKVKLELNMNKIAAKPKNKNRKINLNEFTNATCKESNNCFMGKFY